MPPAPPPPLALVVAVVVAVPPVPVVTASVIAVAVVVVVVVVGAVVSLPLQAASKEPTERTPTAVSFILLFMVVFFQLTIVLVLPQTAT